MTSENGKRGIIKSEAIITMIGDLLFSFDQNIDEPQD